MNCIRVAQMTLSMGQGGIENLILSMVRHQSVERFRTSVYCLDDGGELLDLIREMGHPTHVFSRKPGLDLGLIRKLARSMRKEGINILHTHNQAAHFYGTLAARLIGIPVINTEHSRHNTDGARRRRFEKRILSFLSARLVTVSEELKAASTVKDGIPDTKIEVVGNGVDVTRFSLTSPDSRRRTREMLGLKKNQKIVCIVARLHPIKNHSLLIQAMSKIRDVYPDVHLLVIGDGELRGELERLTRKLGLSETISFLGNRLDIPELLGISDLLVLCSHSEGLPLVLLEAMAAGLPIVVTEGANRSEIIRAGENGFVCPPDSGALAKAILNSLQEEQATKAAARARKEVDECFSIKATIDRYQQIYLDLLPHSRKPTGLVTGMGASR